MIAFDRLGNGGGTCTHHIFQSPLSVLFGLSHIMPAERRHCSRPQNDATLNALHNLVNVSNEDTFNMLFYASVGQDNICIDEHSFILIGNIRKLRHHRFQEFGIEDRYF